MKLKGEWGYEFGRKRGSQEDIPPLQRKFRRTAKKGGYRRLTIVALVTDESGNAITRRVRPFVFRWKLQCGSKQPPECELELEVDGQVGKVRGNRQTDR